MTAKTPRQIQPTVAAQGAVTANRRINPATRSTSCMLDFHRARRRLGSRGRPVSRSLRVVGHAPAANGRGKLDSGEPLVVGGVARALDLDDERVVASEGL